MSKITVKLSRGMTEAQEQEALFNWCWAMRKQLPELELLYHIPNGGSRNALEAANLKRQGVKAGVPDLCLPVARSGFHGLYIEMKVEGNRPTEKQTRWMASLERQGYDTAVCYTWQQAAGLLEDYIRERRVYGEKEERASSVPPCMDCRRHELGEGVWGTLTAEEKIERIMNVACELCHKPYVTEDEDELYEVFDKCPLAALVEQWAKEERV